MKEQNENIKMLNLINDNALMGIKEIDKILSKVSEEELAKLIKKQQQEYNSISSDANKLLLQYGVKSEGLSPVKDISNAIISAAMTVNLDDKKIAKLMMEGSEKGVIAITSNLNAYTGNDKEIEELAHRLLKLIDDNREEFKKYL